MLTHVNAENKPTMVDVSSKVATERWAKARATVILPDEVMSLFQDGDISTKKGPVFHTAIIAGTMAVKNTSDMIPFCHPMPIESCHVHLHIEGQGRLIIECEVKTFNKTGIEMEALCGASVAALTVYDMCKAASHNIKIQEIKLLEKRGGKSDYSSKSKK